MPSNQELNQIINSYNNKKVDNDNKLLITPIVIGLGLIVLFGLIFYRVRKNRFRS